MTNKGDEANFFVAGINYRKTDAVTRGKYALRADMLDAVLIKARQAGSTDLIVISTCNRTEIYCYASSPYLLIKLLCELKHIRLIRVDELSKLKDDTLTQRRTEIPHAKKIISAHLHDFTLWQERRKDAPLLHHLKCTLIHIQKDPVFLVHHNHPPKITEQKIRKLLGQMAKKFSEQERNGCHFISAINQFMN